MKRFILVSMVILIAGALLISGCGTEEPSPATTPATTPGPAPAETITLKLGYDTPPPTPLGVSAQAFADKLNEISNGRLVAELYPAATLSSQASSIETLTAGIADIYILSVGANTNYFPVNNYTSLPGLSFFPDTNELLKKNSDTMREINAKFPAAAAEWSEIKFLWNDNYTTAVLMSGGAPIRTPQDIQGKKVGCNGMRHDMINLIGGVGVFTIPPEMYQQIQTGVCDAVFVAWPAAGDWQLQEVVKNVYDFSFGDAAMPVGMNMDTWSSLSPEYQGMVMEAAAAGEQANRDINVKFIAQNRQTWADAGVEILKPTAEEVALWEAEFAKMWDVYLEDNKDVPGIQDIFNYWKDAVYSTR